MKKLIKTLFAASAVGAAGYFAAADLVQRFISDRKFEIPQGLNALVSGSDYDEIGRICAENRRWLESYGFEKYEMQSDRGYRLQGYLMRPEKPSDVYILGCHGHRCDGRTEFNAFAQYYLRKGINVFLIDHVASGESGGRYISMGKFEHEDAIKWLGFLTDTFGRDIKIIVHGVSMGAATVMLMAGSGRLPENVKLIVEDCGYTSAMDEFEFKLNSFNIPPKPILDTVNAISRKRADFDFSETNALEAVKNARVPMLFVHGTGDLFVPVHMVNQLYEACGSENKELLIIDGAAHAMSFIKDRAKYEAKLDEMLSKFVFEDNFSRV